MTDENYTPPASDLSHSPNQLETIIKPLMETKPWVRLCSIVGFVFGGFMFFGGLGIFALQSNQEISKAFEIAGSIKTVGFMYLIFGLFYFIPSFYLHKYAGSINKANLTREIEDIEKALIYQKSLWKFVGIITLIFTILMVIVFILGMISGFQRG